MPGKNAENNLKNLQKIKILQLNAYDFYLPDKIFSYIKKHQPDIITLQEITDGKLNKCDDKATNFFEKLKTEFGYTGAYAPKFAWQDEEKKPWHWGNAILSKFEILDFDIQFQPSLPDFETFPTDHPYFNIEGPDSLEKKNIRYGYSFDHPQNVIFATLKINQNLTIRVVTTHLTVSYNCTETKQMLDQSRFLLKQLKRRSNLPTIVAGDFNIHPQSLTVKSFLDDDFVWLNEGSKNSLDKKQHVIFNKFPDHEGLNVDYIFAKGFKNGTANVDDLAEISDHAPVLGVLEI